MYADCSIMKALSGAVVSAAVGDPQGAAGALVDVVPAESGDLVETPESHATLEWDQTVLDGCDPSLSGDAVPPPGL